MIKNKTNKVGKSTKKAYTELVCFLGDKITIFPSYYIFLIIINDLTVKSRIMPHIPALVHIVNRIIDAISSPFAILCSPFGNSSYGIVAPDKNNIGKYTSEVTAFTDLIVLHRLAINNPIFKFGSSLNALAAIV